MPSLIPTSTRSTGHNGVLIPPRQGGGDDGGGDGAPNRMPNYGARLRHARLGLAIAMGPIIILFISFTVVYLVRRGYLSFDPGRNSYVRAWIPVQLPWFILLINTAILGASSVTIEFARRAITREAALAPVRSIPGVSLGDESRFPWLVITAALGFLFLAGQLVAWHSLSIHGFHLVGSTSNSFIYVLTAAHGIHLAGGLLALVFASLGALFHRNVQSRRIIVDVTSWYWHCMTAIWVYILVLFYFAAK
jgi:cytochrome c oxidase subunit 3